MFRDGICAVAVLVTLAGSASADWFTRSMDSVCSDVQAINQWPHPYICPDRASVDAPFALMVANGWRRENLMAQHHFIENADGQLELSKAGQMKVYWILTQAPPAHRTIFVERDARAAETTERVDAVQQFAVQLAPAGGLPDIQETHLIAEGRPADEVDRTNVRYHESMPTPQLPAFQSAVDQ